jgi:alpha-mannosidase
MSVVHMVGNAHIDPVWLWQWPEGYQEVRATFQSAIDRMEEYPEFVFTCDSVVYLHWVEESDPELFEQIRRRVAEGRFHVIGGWWVEPDCNLPSGESFARQALYGQRYLRDRFGAIATVGSNVDPFGHNAMLPQLLRKSGHDSYVFFRPGPDELELPAQTFWWQSPDGSRVLAYRIPHEYNSPTGDIGEHIEAALAKLPADGPALMVFYGVGNHGGGPTKANLESIRRLGETNDRRVTCSSARAFFDAIGAPDDLPVHADELQHHAVGCYSAHSGVKRWNRRTENLLQRAEKWAAVADVLGGPSYPHEDLTEAWKLVLFNQFHDTLAGTSIRPAYEDSRDQYGHAASLAANAFNRAVQAISRRIDIPAEPELRPLVVFNAHPWRLQADVEFEYTWLPKDGARMTDADGEAIHVQAIRPHTTMSSSRGRLVFPADVPPLGYRVYRIYAGADEHASTLRATDTTLENDLLALEVDPATGWLARLEDKTTGVDVAAPGAHAVAVDDPTDTWGHNARTFDQVVGSFECTSVRLVEHGPVRAVLRVESAFGASTLVEEIVLGAHAKFIEVRAALDWRERLRLLKLRFPTTIGATAATYEIPYGHLRRPTDGAEEPGQSWVDVSDGRAGLSVANDSKYAYDVRGGEIGITAARSPVYAWHDPRVLDEPHGRYEFIDQGRQDVVYRLLPHAGDWREAGTVRLAAELNQPAFPLIESYHGGDLSPEASFASDGGGAVVVTMLKAAEDGNGLVVRAHESTGRPARATIELPLVERTIEADFGPSEIKTFVVQRDRARTILETNLLEW